MKTLRINDKDLPVAFTRNFLRILEIKYDIVISNLKSLLTLKPFDTMAALCHTGLQEGARVNNQYFDMTIEEVNDAWDKDETLMEKFMSLMNDSDLLKNKKQEAKN